MVYYKPSNQLRLRILPVIQISNVAENFPRSTENRSEKLGIEGMLVWKFRKMDREAKLLPLPR